MTGPTSTVRMPPWERVILAAWPDGEWLTIAEVADLCEDLGHQVTPVSDTEGIVRYQVGESLFLDQVLRNAHRQSWLIANSNKDRDRGAGRPPLPKRYSRTPKGARESQAVTL